MAYKRSNRVICGNCENEFYGDEKMFHFHGSWLCEDCFKEQVKKHYVDEIDEEDSAISWANDLNFYHSTVENICDNEYCLALETIYEARRGE